jgi:fructose-bisphosphate aldolase class I
MSELADIARAMVAPGKGVLAADESDGTIKKRFDTIGVESTYENRRDYRQLLFTTDGAEEFISGVILFDETARQKTDDGQPLLHILESKGILPGIKVDKGAKPLAGAPGEKVTEGLDGLRPRLEEYRAMGCRFAKWRAVITIDTAKGLPSEVAARANAHALARYAALCVEQDLVPIVEPEVLMDGNHTIDDCFAATELALKRLYEELYDQRVPLEQTILKPNMVLSGSECVRQAGVDEVAAATIRCFRRAVPAAVPGIVFLSGGQTEEEATVHLNAINRRAGSPVSRDDAPWQFSFSYGRALQASALQAWLGKAENVASAQQAFLKRARLNGAARRGEYTAAMEAA